MKTLILFITVAIPMLKLPMGNEVCKTKNKMEVCWQHKKDEIEFTLKAPTRGWLAIGFNEKQGLAGTYLLMARVFNGKVEVVEHFTKSPGNYASIASLGATPCTKVVVGEQSKNLTNVTFRIPTKACHQFAKNFTKGTSYNMLMAYSQDDDFQHHSLMRTNIEITL